ncbi:ferritin-like domain-containing protein [Pseudoblastomonas halimionae]|uniref:Ferritin-like domain-containing protein n=1 Tax=Alteriqipengyuania halimionae TaxID=1926630 RepID=A0A6I4U2F3_9SPHN|nr:ferritin-like domain-containing protein [Alteriqipengyuania halimionae]MXP10249.1 ferritin-like domain-containing protein [Alteriqipengyuania halimionae]
MLTWFRNRYLDVLGSIYIYNEHRGYTAIDRVLEAVRARYPDDQQLIAAVEQHRADERKHYVMFKRWFELRGTRPLAVDRMFGHIDRFIEIMFRRTIDGLDTREIVEKDHLFERLCRVISLTEQRGYRQVEILLANGFVTSDKRLVKIFEIIREDEPSHWAPYDGWLQANAKRDPKWWERAVDGLVHSELLFLKLPILFLNPFAKRRTDWSDDGEVEPDRYARKLRVGAA